MTREKGMIDVPHSSRVQHWRRSPTRRTVLAGAAAMVGWGLWSATRAQPRPVNRPQKVSFGALVARARAAAEQEFRAAPKPAAEAMERIDYSAHWKITFRDRATLYPAGDDAPVQLFHPGRYFPTPVRIHLRDGTGMARALEFSREMFAIPADSPARDLPPDVGFAGFRVMRSDLATDWISFLGASYFRTDGPERQYGLSARGLAVNTGLATPEEFPRFTSFWLGPPEREGEDLSVWAELDGPSVTGAYRFGLQRGTVGGGHLTRVSARLFMRKDVQRLGIAPLTSMYWYSQRDRIIGDDWRPEIHDSDGLALATGAGERLWRPLNNPQRVITSSFLDENPRGFGLIQRDRRFANYQDDGVFYDRRPSAWIRPRGDWGRGAVQLVQIPTQDETFDNIVAYWVPERPARAGEAYRFDYDIEWRTRDPRPDSVARVTATWQGQGGVPGDPRPEGVGKMVIDFDGPSLSGLNRDSRVEPVVEARNGSIREPIAAYPVVGTKLWRLAFDFAQAGDAPVSLRAYLRRDGAALTETWLTDAWVDRRE